MLYSGKQIVSVQSSLSEFKIIFFFLLDQLVWPLNRLWDVRSGKIAQTLKTNAPITSALMAQVCISMLGNAMKCICSLLTK